MAELNDAEHELILDNPEADKFIAEQAVKRAMASGISREDAERMYGYRPPPDEDIGIEDYNRITKEVVLGLAPAQPDGPEAAEFRVKVTKEVEEAKANGLVIDLPAE